MTIWGAPGEVVSDCAVDGRHVFIRRGGNCIRCGAVRPLRRASGSDRAVCAHQYRALYGTDFLRCTWCGEPKPDKLKVGPDGLPLPKKRKAPAVPKKKKRPTFNNRGATVWALIERQGGMWCWYCTVSLAPADVTIDHAQPLLLEGTHEMENFRLCCGTCNHFKGATTEQEYRTSAQLALRQRQIAGARMVELGYWEQQRD